MTDSEILHWLSSFLAAASARFVAAPLARIGMWRFLLAGFLISSEALPKKLRGQIVNSNTAPTIMGEVVH